MYFLKMPGCFIVLVLNTRFEACSVRGGGHVCERARSPACLWHRGPRSEGRVEMQMSSPAASFTLRMGTNSDQ